MNAADGDCPICLDEMTQADFDHPLQCPRHCGFNFCRSCIESLISSSKDDYEEASDGNRHVKVFLHCPNCRSDLSSSIRDTVLLRKTDEALAVKPNDMNESQRGLKEAFETSQQVKTALNEARLAERKYLGLFVEDEKKEDTAVRQDSLHSVEEWGVEVGLDVGVHNSIRLPKAPAKPKPKKFDDDECRRALVDPTLFNGLDYFMQDDERNYITELMTSGNPEKLAEAAELLHRIAIESRKAPLTKNNMSPKRTLIKRSSVFQLIQESKEAHQKAEEKAALAKGVLPLHMGRNLHKEQVREWKRSAQHRASLTPLPVRMPKFIELHNIQPDDYGISLCDDTWDGTVVDAYSKISVGRNGAVTKKNKEAHQGVRNVLGKGYGHIEVPGTPRALVSKLSREAGMQGVVKGDVVTHINKAPVFNKTAAEVREFLYMLVPEDPKDSPVSIVLNAEPSVAEALRRRSFLVRN